MTACLEGQTDVVKSAQISWIPRDVAAAIKRRFPGGMVNEFPTDESYFQAIRANVESDLRRIHGASLLWQTADEEERGSVDSCDDEPLAEEWRSYYVFFLAPDGDAFHVLDETGAIEESAEAEEDAAPGAWPDATSPGEEWTECAVGVSLAARYAVINLDCYAQYEDGTVRIPDVESFIYSDRTGERVDTFQHLREMLEPAAFHELVALGDRIVSILRKHRIRMLSESILNLYVPGLKPSTEVFLEAPLRVRDAFFFRGI